MEVRLAISRQLLKLGDKYMGAHYMFLLFEIFFKKFEIS